MIDFLIQENNSVSDSISQKSTNINLGHNYKTKTQTLIAIEIFTKLTLMLLESRFLILTIKKNSKNKITHEWYHPYLTLTYRSAKFLDYFELQLASDQLVAFTSLIHPGVVLIFQKIFCLDDESQLVRWMRLVVFDHVLYQACWLLGLLLAFCSRIVRAN